MYLAVIDVVTPLAYLAIILWLGVVSARRVETTDDLFLAGRSMGFGLIGLSLFASNISSSTLIGVAGAAYQSGISVANYEWMAGLALLFTAVFLVPIYLRNRFKTVPEYLEVRYSLGCRRYVSAMMIILSILVDTAGSLYAGALVLRVLVPELPFWPTTLLLGLFAGLYTMMGGLRAVMLTDALQSIVLLIGSTVMAVMVFAQFDYSWSNMISMMPADHLSLIRSADDPDMPWTGLLVGVPVLGLYYWSMNHYVTQRFFAARNEDHARWGATLAAMLKLLPLFIMVLPGAAAVVLYPGLTRADDVFPTLIKELLPVGLKGLVLAALMSAIMSTVDSTVNAAGALVNYDFLPQPKADRSDQQQRQYLRRARAVTLFFIALAIAWTPIIQFFPGLFSYLQQIFSVAVPPVVVIFLSGMFWRGANRHGAWAALLVGHGLGILFLIERQAGLWPLHFLETVGFTTALCLLTLVCVSLYWPVRVEREARVTQAQLFWGSHMLGMEHPYSLLKDYRAQAVGILCLTACLVVWLW